MNTFKLILKQTSSKLSPYKQLVKLARPKTGWICTVREALGMNTNQLAKRIGVNQSTIVRFEQAEAEGAITLRSLKALANAMNCELVYALVPKTSLEETIKTQAQKMAKEQLARISHHMLLENQLPNDKQLAEIYQELLEELLTKHPKKIWG